VQTAKAVARAAAPRVQKSKTNTHTRRVCCVLCLLMAFEKQNVYMFFCMTGFNVYTSF
jgi:hypothetical protein